MQTPASQPSFPPPFDSSGSKPWHSVPPAFRPESPAATSRQLPPKALINLRQLAETLRVLEPEPQELARLAAQLALAQQPELQEPEAANSALRARPASPQTVMDTALPGLPASAKAMAEHPALSARAMTALLEAGEVPAVSAQPRVTGLMVWPPAAMGLVSARLRALQVVEQKVAVVVAA